MKAISMMQPYAWLFSHGILSIDDRSWKTNYTGKIAFHASLKNDHAYFNFIKYKTDIKIPNLEDMEHGGIVGVGSLIKCAPNTRFQPNDDLASFIDKTFDLKRSHFGLLGFNKNSPNESLRFFGFEFDEQKPASFTPCRGKIGLFDI